MPLRSIIGSVMGYCAGEFLKRFTKKIAAYSTGAMILIGTLAYANWITINWSKIDKDLISIVFRGTRAATALTCYLKRMLTHFIPLAGGFYIGLRYALGNQFVPV